MSAGSFVFDWSVVNPTTQETHRYVFHVPPEEEPFYLLDIFAEYVNTEYGDGEARVERTPPPRSGERPA